jgi:hypothetical protein
MRGLLRGGGTDGGRRRQNAVLVSCTGDSIARIEVRIEPNIRGLACTWINNLQPIVEMALFSHPGLGPTPEVQHSIEKNVFLLNCDDEVGGFCALAIAGLANRIKQRIEDLLMDARLIWLL